MIEDPRDTDETPEEGEPTPDGVAPPEPEGEAPAAEAAESGTDEPASAESAPEDPESETPAPEAGDEAATAAEPEPEELEASEPEAGDEPATAAEPEPEEPEASEPEAGEEPAPEAEEPEPPATPDEPAPTPEEPVEAAAADDTEPAAEPEAGDGAASEPPAHPERPAPSERLRKEEVIPGAHLEPDLVLEEEGAGSETEQTLAGEEFEAEQAALAQGDGSEDDADQPLVREPLDLAKDARYQATGKRKHAIARVILKPGDGTYRVNGRSLDDVFPRVKLQRMARQPLETAGYGSRMDVAARIHGGGVSAQAGALRHGIARALVEADPNLRVELKKRGFLTRDPRVKERKKAGLKKARKRPQFSKR